VIVCALSTSALAQKILLFVENFSNMEFYSYQRLPALRIIESLLRNDGDVITCLFSRQSGKSNMLAALGAGLTVILPVLARTFPDDERLARLDTWGSGRGIQIGIFGPNQESTGPIYERMREIVMSEHAQEICADPEISVHLVQSRGDSLQWNTGARVRAKTANEGAFVEGKTYHLVIIDEAQKVLGAKVRKEISPMLAATNGTMVKIGTAWMSRGGFHLDIQTNILVQKNGGKQNHFEFDYEIVIREKRALYDRQKRSYDQYQQQMADLRAGRRKEPPAANLRTVVPDATHLSYEKWLTGEIRRLGGTHSEEFKMNFKLAWQESRQIAFTDDELTRGAMPNVEMVSSQRRGVIVAGLDIAKSNDSTVLTVTEVDFSIPIHEADVSRAQTTPVDVHYIKRILGWKELQGSFENLQYGGIVDFLSGFAVQRLVGDSTGMGDPVMERLEVLLAPLAIEVVPFRYGTASKSDLYKYYLQEFKSGRIQYPAGELTQDSIEFRHFIEQHSDLVREYVGSYLSCSASEESLHDDYPDSSALAVWASRDIMTARELPSMEVSGFGAVGVTRFGSGGPSRLERYRRHR